MVVMEDYILSIIVVCFNERNRIEITLKSILKQSCKNIECIIVDGGSKDGTLDVVKVYQEKFIRVGIKTKVISEADRGIYDAMNKGVENANGSWVYFLNAGDEFCGKETVEEVFASREKEDEILIGKVIFFDGYLGRTVEQSSVEGLKKDMVFCHQAVFALKKLLQNHNFDIGYKYCADYEWLLAMYLDGRNIRCIDTVVANYDGDGVSNKYADCSKKEMQQIRKKYGFTENETDVRKINHKYRLYKEFGKYKALSWCFYHLYGKSRKYYFKRV